MALAKKMVAGFALFGALSIPGIALAATSSADDRSDTYGCLSCYNENPGRQQAEEVGAQNGSGAGSGAFGYFGKHYDSTDDTTENSNLSDGPDGGHGTDGTKTGLNNSGVAGNRQGNLP